MEGWIKVHRSIMDNWLWQEKTYSRLQAWLEIIMLANHTGKKARLGNEFVYVERGSLITSELKLSARWGWSKTKVRAFLTMLENDKMIEKKTDRKKTTITIVNYGIYQEPQTTEEPQKDYEKTTKEPQKNTNKNVKNDKNEKKVLKTIVRFTPPDVDMVREYCVERGNSVNPQTFVDFYSSKGWMVGKNKMKDWKAAVRTWEKNDRGQTRQEVTAKRDPISEVDNW